MCKKGVNVICPGAPKAMMQARPMDFKEDTTFFLKILHSYKEGAFDKITCLYSKNGKTDYEFSYVNQPGHSLYPYNKKEWKIQSTGIETCDPRAYPCAIFDNW
jgi:hypothetical protein